MDDRTSSYVVKIFDIQLHKSILGLVFTRDRTIGRTMDIETRRLQKISAKRNERTRNTEAGLKRVELWIHPSRREQLRAMESRLRKPLKEKYSISYDPSTRSATLEDITQQALDKLR